MMKLWLFAPGFHGTIQGHRWRKAVPLSLSIALAACAGTAHTVAPSEPGPALAKEAKPKPAVEVSRLERGKAHFKASRYAKAEADLRAAAEEPAKAAAAGLALARVLELTGRYEEAIEAAQKARSTSKELARDAAVIEAEALRRQGRLDEAKDALAPHKDKPDARRVRLLLGSILVEQGRRSEAEPYLLSLIEDYNADRITSKDGFELAMVGRAAHLLRSPPDANDAYNEAERVLEGDPQTLMWRAELFLEAYNPGDAEAVVQEVLEAAPNHPDANVWMAHVRLDQALDFDEAERLAKKALEINPRHTGAYFVLAGIALRDMEIGLAEERIAKGLEHNPRDLELLSMRATARYLAEDEAGLEAVKTKIFSFNKQFSKFYNIVGEYADWEHRYDEIVEMMREALMLDPDNAKARAQLGLNLIRAGNERKGVTALKHAFGQDPYNVRVHNTLNLYEETIPKHYVTVEHGRFKIRYHKEERQILERYVPQLLDEAWAKMVERYDFHPHTPVGVELYAQRSDFAIRTSGLPQTAIQGVCFGKTLASMSLKVEKFNLAMTLWHELAHVFHIQMSRSRVPRWFTEGLAEYETLVERTEWAREHDPDLYRALRDQRLPKLGAMSRAFTRAEELKDVATAYYASSQILVMLAEEYGAERLAKMLRAWGEGKPTEEVTQTVLGKSTEELDVEFRLWTRQQLARYDHQFMPITRSGPMEVLEKRIKKEPKNPELLSRYALAMLRSGGLERATELVKTALKADPKHLDARFLSAKIASASDRPPEAKVILQDLIAEGHDGYDVQMLLAGVASALKDETAVSEAYEKAHAFDPTQAEPIAALAVRAAKRGDDDAEIAALRKLVMLEEHNPAPFRKLLSKLLDAGRTEEALMVGQAAVYADMSGLKTHLLYARALQAAERWKDAEYELVSATMSEGRPSDKARAHAVLAKHYLQQGQRDLANEQAEKLRQIDAKHPELEQLDL